MAPTVFKGTLRSKRKNELMDMANAAGLKIDEALSKRDEIEVALKAHLINQRNRLENLAQWAGVYHSLDQSDKRAGNTTALSPDSDASDDGATARKHTQKSRASTLANGITASTPLRRTAATAEQGASNIATAFTAKARRSFENLGSAFRAGTSEVSNEVSDAAADVSQASTQARRQARRSVSRIEKRVEQAFVRTRAYLSDAQNLAMLLLVFEATLLVAHIMPSATIRLGENPLRAMAKNAAHGKASTGAHITVTVPNLWVLLTSAFWRPVILWTLWTAAVPVVAAHLITFDRKHEPSPLTFALVRLAVLSLASKRVLFTSSSSFPHVVGVAAGEVRQTTASYLGSWLQLVEALVSYDYVAPFLAIDVQLLLTSLTAGLAAYEVTATRPRG